MQVILKSQPLLILQTSTPTPAPTTMPSSSTSTQTNTLSEDQKVLVATIAAEATVTAQGNPVSSAGRQAMPMLL